MPFLGKVILPSMLPLVGGAAVIALGVANAEAMPSDSPVQLEMICSNRSWNRSL